MLILQGKNISHFLDEAGVHRVQRVSKGKMHTSTVTVSVLEIKENKKRYDEDEFVFETFRASGAGGQHRNTTDSAIRLIHIPTGTTVISASQRSQHKNKYIAMTVMQERLMEMEEQKKSNKINSKRRKQIKHGDRSEASRTYNYPRGEIIDYNGTRMDLKDFMKGNIGK